MPMTLEAGSKDAQVFSRPLVILVNESTASTAELITNALQEQNRATVFGTNSCGCVLAFLDYKLLKGGGDLTLSEFGFITAKGKKLEGNGVMPDKIVPLTLKDIQNGRDAALEQSERFLSDPVK
jgi:carboxyl-terminal processing protease